MCSVSHLAGWQKSLQGNHSGFAAFAATVLLAIAVEQALGDLK